MPIAMMTTFGLGRPRSVPMARQEVEPGAELWFITARDTAHVRAIEPGASGVGDLLVARTAWVALTGTATVVDDAEKLEGAVEHLRRGLAARKAPRTRTRP